MKGAPGPPSEQAAILAAAGPGLAAQLESAEQRLAEIPARAGPILGPHLRRTLDAGGKRLRPMLVFLCARRGAESEPVLRAAVGVELLHTATLVHDDVLDRSPLRRGRPTVFAAGGRLEATAAGDLLLARAFAELTATDDPAAVRELSAASSALVRGELMQRADAWAAAVSVERYVERCELKTARLFEAACRLGALLGGSAGAGAALGRFGAAIGLAFQIFDDVLDVSGSAERTGKQRGTDLLDGTVTLPLIFAREGDPGLRSLDLRTIDAAGAAEVCERISSTGALERSRERALEYVARAKTALADVELEDAGRRALELVADGVVERYS